MIFHAADLNMWQLLQDIQREVRELREGQMYQQEPMAEVLEEKMAEVLKEHMGDILEENMSDIMQADGVEELEQKVDELKEQMNRVEKMSAVVCRPFFSERWIEMSADVQ
jgi:gamma-glutamyl phosphate reductase